MRFFGRRNGATGAARRDNNVTLNTAPKQLLAPGTMMESDVSSTSTGSGLHEINLSSKQQAALSYSNADVDWEGTNHNKQERQSNDQSNIEDERNKARSSVKDLMNRMKVRPVARSLVFQPEQRRLPTPPRTRQASLLSAASTARPVLITVNDGIDEDLNRRDINPLLVSHPNVLRTRPPTGMRVPEPDLFASKQRFMSDLTTAVDRSLSAHFIRNTLSHDEDESLFSDDTSAMSFTTGTSFSTGMSQSTGFSGSTGFTLSTVGTHSVYTELTGNTVSVFPDLDINSEEDSVSILTARNKKGLANAIADDFAGLLLDVVRGGNDILSCAVDNACSNNGEGLFEVSQSSRMRYGRPGRLHRG